MGKGANYTRKRRPVHIVYFEEYHSVEDAFNREKQIQNWSKKKKQALIERNWDRLKELANCVNDTHFKNQKTKE